MQNFSESNFVISGSTTRQEEHHKSEDLVAEVGWTEKLHNSGKHDLQLTENNKEPENRLSDNLLACIAGGLCRSKKK